MNDEYITLVKLLDFPGSVLDDEHMTELLNSDEVLVNGSVEHDPDRKLYQSDEVQIRDQIIVVDFPQQEE